LTRLFSATKYFGDWKNATAKFFKLDNTVLLKVTRLLKRPKNLIPHKGLLSYETFKRYGENIGLGQRRGSLSSNHQYMYYCRKMPM